jgi:hypothetical protein
MDYQEFRTFMAYPAIDLLRGDIPHHLLEIREAIKLGD